MRTVHGTDWARRRSRLQRGGALVEEAIGFAFIIFFIFGIVEVGYVFHDQSSVINAGREGARGIAAGDTIETATSRAQSHTPGIITANLSLNYYYSTDNGSTWTAVTDTTVTDPGQQTSFTTNNAPGGSLIKAVVTYQHNYITHYMNNNASVTLTSNTVLRREN